MTKIKFLGYASGLGRQQLIERTSIHDEFPDEEVIGSYPGMMEQSGLNGLNYNMAGSAMPQQGRCILGEGLFLAGDRVTWVDIARNLLYVRDQDGSRSFTLPVTATLVLASNESRALVASISGIGSVNIHTGGYQEVIRFGLEVRPNTHRTNDGCILSDGRYLVGTMHKTDPGRNYGSVLLVNSDGSFSQLCSDIHIPNTFVEMANGDVLVTDSLTGAIFRYKFREDPKSCGRSLWHQARTGISPDGGCRLSKNRIAIAMWDGASIGFFENDGVKIAEIGVPAKRPTNTKYCKERKALWVTSAIDGLTQADIERYPLSGKTFMIPDPLALICN